MVWFKVDDSFYDHPKVFDAPDCAVALWTRAGCWAARNLTDGFVPSGMLARLCDDPDRAAKELADRGLWSRARGGYQFHDWSTYQLLREEVQASREKISSGATLGNHRRWHVNRGVVDPGCKHCQGEQASPFDRDTHRGGDRVADSGANPPVPARPVPQSQNTPPPDEPVETEEDLFGASHVAKPEPPPKPGSDNDPGWVAFWEAFPRKEGKAEARIAYAKAVAKPGVTAGILAEGAQRYADRMSRERTERQKIKMAQGWLNGERWNDETRPATIGAPRRGWMDN